MSKERLEEISKNATGIMNMDSGTVDSIDLSIIDFTWLFQFAKEQSERLQELETDYVILGVEQEEEIMSELESLRQQNKRYRERIEEIEAKNWEFIVQNKRYCEAIKKAMNELVTPGMTKTNVYRTLNFALESE